MGFGISLGSFLLKCDSVEQKEMGRAESRRKGKLSTKTLGRDIPVPLKSSARALQVATDVSFFVGLRFMCKGSFLGAVIIHQSAIIIFHNL
jgi:hypothetical protein